jgi:hypothetical protein
MEAMDGGVTGPDAGGARPPAAGADAGGTSAGPVSRPRVGGCSYGGPPGAGLSFLLLAAVWLVGNRRRASGHRR